MNIYVMTFTHRQDHTRNNEDKMKDLITIILNLIAIVLGLGAIVALWALPIIATVVVGYYTYQWLAG